MAESHKAVSVSTQQFRLRRLQVLNWGTFSALHDIPIAEEGFLIVGRSGSGKSTLLDALSTLLVPPHWVVFNAAAREGEKGRQDRHLGSYVRGAWSDQTDSGTGEIATRYLRTGSTWSALAAEYATREGQVVSLAQVFWIKGSSNRATDVKRHFMVVDRPFEVASDLKDFGDLDLRRLKQRLLDVHHFDVFSAYGECFRRKLGIESELAMKLLHKTQSAKNLGDLNGFVREFMLDRPGTFEVAEQLVEEFAELDAAHQTVVTARRQVDALSPARKEYERLQSVEQEIKRLDVQLSAVDAYRDERKVTLLALECERLLTKDQGLEGEERRQREILESQKETLKALEDEHRQKGGARIQELEREKAEVEEQRSRRLEKRLLAQGACVTLERALPERAADFATLSSWARGYLEELPARQEKASMLRDMLRDREREVDVNGRAKGATSWSGYRGPVSPWLLCPTASL